MGNCTSTSKGSVKDIHSSSPASKGTPQNSASLWESVRGSNLKIQIAETNDSYPRDTGQNHKDVFQPVVPTFPNPQDVEQPPVVVAQKLDQSTNLLSTDIHFCDFLSFFRSRRSTFGLISKRLMSSLPKSISSTADTPYSISHVMLCPTTCLTPASDTMQDIRISRNSHYLQHVLFPTTKEQLVVLQKLYQAQELQNMAEGECNFHGNRIPYSWELFLARPKFNKLDDKLDVAFIICRRVFLYFSVFVQPHYEKSRPYSTNSRLCSSNRESSGRPASLETYLRHREWNSERRSLRSALFMSDRFSAETEYLLSRAKNDEIDYLDVLPSYSESLIKRILSLFGRSSVGSCFGT